MSHRGRPTLYKPEYPDLARRFCQLGGTNEDLADYFEVSRSTIDEWLRVHDDFAEAVRRGRDGIDMVVADQLLSRIMGYTHEGRKFVLYKGEEKEVRHVVHYPPDVQACIFWLRNRRRKQWLEGAKEEPDNGLTVLEIEEAAERARRMREQTHEQ
ncbi:MAG: helix-turn-helix domain-containing protein [Alphaproteobacteria bacterium]|nr:helix-turn-helix domain-containing protein [Alphaproteobacteria bacterium]